MAEIRLERLRKEFGGFVAVDDVDLRIADGSFFVLLGPSGCGKTTTLRMIAGLERPTSGRILLDEQDVTELRAGKRDIAFMFQLFALYPHLNVRRNIAYPLRSRGVRRREIEQRVREAARLLGIEHLLGRRIRGLSGGDQQRVALARALVRRPRAFLMDEPLGTLDAAFRERMCEELRALHDRIGATTVYVTHDQIEAMRMADVIAVMNGGRVEQLGPPQELYRRPGSMFVAGFIGSPAMNLIPCQLQEKDGGLVPSLSGIPLPGFSPGARVPDLVLGIRPEHISIDPDSPLSAEVVTVEYLGSRQIVLLDSPFGRFQLRAGGQVRLSVGDRVGVRFDASRAVFFDGRSGRSIHRDASTEPVHG